MEENMYTFKAYDKFTEEEKQELFSHFYYSIFMENEKIVLGLNKQSCPERLHKYFEKDYIVLGELNLNEMADYSYESYTIITIKFETKGILQKLMSLKSLFPLYINGEFLDIRNETFFLFDIKHNVISFLEESLKLKYNIDYSIFKLKELEPYCISNIFTYSSDCYASILQYLRVQFDRYYNQESIDEKTASKALFDLLNKKIIEGGEEPLDESISFNLKRVDGFNNLYEVLKECYNSYLRRNDEYKEDFKAITDSDKHETFVLDLEKFLREINILDNVETNNDLLVFSCNEKVYTEHGEYENTFVCFYNNFIVVFSNVFVY